MFTIINEFKMNENNYSHKYDQFSSGLINREIPPYNVAPYNDETDDDVSHYMPDIGEEWGNEDWGNDPLTTEEKQSLYNDYLVWDGYGNPSETLWEAEFEDDEDLPLVSSYVNSRLDDFPRKEISLFKFFILLHNY